MGLLSQNPQLRQTVGLNGMFWFTMSGTQMTLLSLIMVSPAYNLISYEIGGSFALMSLISFLTAQPLAAIADKYGKVPSIMAGCTMLAGSMAGIPFAKEITSGAVTTAGDALASLGAEVGSEALLLSMADTSSALLLVPVLVPLAMGNIVMNAVPGMYVCMYVCIHLMYVCMYVPTPHTLPTAALISDLTTVGSSPGPVPAQS
jgi:hypothetical protein